MTDPGEVARLRAENAELSRGIAELSRQIGREDYRIDRLRAENAELARQIKAGEARIEQLKLEADALHAEWTGGTRDQLGLPS